MRGPVVCMNAILLFKDLPLFRFELDEEGEFSDYVVFDNCARYLPIEFRDGKISSYDFQIFLKDRIVPETRFRLKEVLAANGIYEYDVKKILIDTNGISADDPYWLKFKGINEEMSWEDVRLK